MSSRSILIAVLALTLNGCAVYDYDDERYDSRYYAGGYNVQRYEVYPAYPQGRRYDYPRHDGYPNRYDYGSHHQGYRADYGRRENYGHHQSYGRHTGYDRHADDRHQGQQQHQRKQSHGARPSQQGWDDQRQHHRDQGRRQQVSNPRAGKSVPQQVNRGRDRGQEHKLAPHQGKSRMQPANLQRHAY